MRNIKDTLSRVRWGVIFGILFSLTAVILLLLVFNPLSPGDKCTGDVCVRTWLEPSEVGLSGESALWIEIRSEGKMDKPIDISLETSTENLLFSENSNRTIIKNVILGPGESRKLDFNLGVDAEYGGEYGIDVKVTFGTKNIADRIYLRVVDKR